MVSLVTTNNTRSHAHMNEFPERTFVLTGCLPLAWKTLGEVGVVSRGCARTGRGIAVSESFLRQMEATALLSTTSYRGVSKVTETTVNKQTNKEETKSPTTNKK